VHCRSAPCRSAHFQTLPKACIYSEVPNVCECWYSSGAFAAMEVFRRCERVIRLNSAVGILGPRQSARRLLRHPLLAGPCSNKDSLCTHLDCRTHKLYRVLREAAAFLQPAQWSCSVNVSNARCVGSHCFVSPAPLRDAVLIVLIILYYSLKHVYASMVNNN
jgi:hypothetical protein